MGRILCILAAALALCACGPAPPPAETSAPTGDVAPGIPPSPEIPQSTGDIDWADPPDVTEDDLDTLYARAVAFLSYDGDERTHPELAAYYAEMLAEKAAVFAASPSTDTFLRIAEFDFNGDGLPDYMVAHLPGGEAGAEHEVLLRGADGALSPVLLSLTHPGFGVLPTKTNGLHDLIGRATGYKLPLRFDGDAYVYDWDDYAPYRGQYGGAPYLEGDFLCQVYSTLHMTGKMDDGMRYYIAARPQPALLEFLEEPLLWAYNPDGSLFVLAYTVDEPVLRGRLRAGTDTAALAALLADGESAAHEILYIKRPLPAGEGGS